MSVVDVDKTTWRLLMDHLLRQAGSRSKTYKAFVRRYHSNRQGRERSALNPWKLLAMLLCAYTPAISFNPSSGGRCSGRGNSALAHWQSLRECQGARRSMGMSQLKMELLEKWWGERHRKVKAVTYWGILDKATTHRKIPKPFRWVPFEYPEDDPSETRFQVVPDGDRYWQGCLRRLWCNVSNQMEWNGTLPVPQANHSCWLVPCEDGMAEHIARLQPELAEAGWKLLTCRPETVASLCNKSNLRDLAEDIGRLHVMPYHWKSAADASYPCILKAAFGVHGDGTYIVKSPEEVAEIASEGLGAKWVLQELIHGDTEYSTSLLVVEGQILDAICMVYEYDSYAYVWPDVKELRKYQTDYVPARHLSTMAAFLQNFSGICNFNYKVRPNGEMGIFEVNVRMGGDLACDVPRPRAAVMFEKLDELSDWQSSGHWQLVPPSLLDSMIMYNNAIALFEKRCGWQRR